MILVTGATGFLGKRVCRQLDLQKIPYEKTSLSMGVDLRDSRQTHALFQELNPKYVLHCASYVGGIQFGLKHSAEIYYNGLLMQANLLEACKDAGVKRLVNPISNCAYPGRASLFKEDEFWEGELHDSVQVYGMVRKLSYIGALAYQQQYRLDTINLILSNMYGPEDHFEAERSHALGALIRRFIEAKENEEPSVCIWGTGKPVREWLYVDDGASAMIRALDIEPYSGIINIGVAKGISIHDMAMLIKELVEYKGNLVYDTSKLDGAPYKTVDGSLGAKLMNWQPSTDFKQGVAETVNWYRKNKKGI